MPPPSATRPYHGELAGMWSADFMNWVRIARQHQPVATQQRHCLPGWQLDRPIEVGQILQIDDTDHEAKKLVVRTVDLSGEVDRRCSGDTTDDRGTDERSGVIVRDEMPVVISVGEIQIAAQLRTRAGEHMAVRPEQRECIGLRHPCQPLAQEGMRGIGVKMLKRVRPFHGLLVSPNATALLAGRGRRPADSDWSARRGRR